MAATTRLKQKTALSTAFEISLAKRSSRQLRRKLSLPTVDSHDFSSNDFLSLSTSPAFRSRFLQYVNQHSAEGDACHPQGLASGGSRLLDGNSAFAENLEKSIARFHDAESALLFNSGYDANIGVYSCIPQPGDLIVYDSLVHASVHDGMRLSRAAQCIPFPHNSPDGLEDVLSALLTRDTALVEGTRNVFVAIETVYSMDGDMALVDRFVEILDRLFPLRNGHLIVDEAHATGVFGPKGSGVVQHFGLQDRVLIRVHTFGKALASHGAVALCSYQTRDYLINYARSLIYTTALPFSALASIQTAYEMLNSEEAEKLQSNLAHLIDHCHNTLFKIGHPASLPYESSEMQTGENHDIGSLRISHEKSSPIFSLMTPHALELADFCQRLGFMVRAVRPPTVPKGTERVRLCLHAGNTIEAIDGFADAIRAWTQKEATILARL